MASLHGPGYRRPAARPSGRLWAVNGDFITLQVNFVEMRALLERYVTFPAFPGCPDWFDRQLTTELGWFRMRLTDGEITRIYEKADPLDVLLSPRRPRLTVVPWKPGKGKG